MRTKKLRANLLYSLSHLLPLMKTPWEADTAKICCSQTGIFLPPKMKSAFFCFLKISIGSYRINRYKISKNDLKIKFIGLWIISELFICNFLDLWCSISAYVKTFIHIIFSFMGWRDISQFYWLFSWNKGINMRCLHSAQCDVKCKFCYFCFSLLAVDYLRWLILGLQASQNAKSGQWMNGSQDGNFRLSSVISFEDLECSRVMLKKISGWPSLLCWKNGFWIASEWDPSRLWWKL